MRTTVFFYCLAINLFAGEIAHAQTLCVRYLLEHPNVSDARFTARGGRLLLTGRAPNKTSIFDGNTGDFISSFDTLLSLPTIRSQHKTEAPFRYMGRNFVLSRQIIDFPNTTFDYFAISELSSGLRPPTLVATIDMFDFPDDTLDDTKIRIIPHRPGSLLLEQTVTLAIQSAETLAARTIEGGSDPDSISLGYFSFAVVSPNGRRILVVPKRGNAGLFSIEELIKRGPRVLRPQSAHYPERSWNIDG